MPRSVPQSTLPSRRAQTDDNRFGGRPAFREVGDAALPRLPRRADRAAVRRLVRRPLVQHAAADRLHRKLVCGGRRGPQFPARVLVEPHGGRPGHLRASSSACRSPTRSIARDRPVVRALARVVYLLPIAVPPLVLAFGFILVFSSDALPCLGSIWVLIGGHLVLDLPYLLQAVVGDMQRLNLRLLETAAESLGATGGSASSRSCCRRCGTQPRRPDHRGGAVDRRVPVLQPGRRLPHPHLSGGAAAGLLWRHRLRLCGDRRAAGAGADRVGRRRRVDAAAPMRPAGARERTNP